MLVSLGVYKSKSNDRIIDVLKNHGQPAFELMKQDLRLTNLIDDYGPKRVEEAIELRATSEKGLDLSLTCRIFDELQEAKNQSGETVHYKLKFTGGIQGVCFRAYSNTFANICDLKYVNAKNMEDGSVVTDVKGAKPLVDLYLKSLKSEYSRNIKDVEIQEI